jgi:hypothetical protein
MNKTLTTLAVAVLLLCACAASSQQAQFDPKASAVDAPSQESTAESPTSTPPATVPTLDLTPTSTAVAARDDDAEATPARPESDPPAETGDLSTTEMEGILFMREEEKLARDIYLSLYETWGIPIFENIARSEATHMDAIKTLIDRYDLQDPAAGNDVGVFVDQGLQDLYDELVATGNQSLASALSVGAAIEEIDILDLEEYLAQTDHADIQQVYQNLARGSRHHLRSFVSNLEKRTAENYEPQYLDQAAYDAILGGTTERGRGS